VEFCVCVELTKMDKFLIKKSIPKEDDPTTLSSTSNTQSETNLPPTDIAAIGDDIIHIKLPSYPKKQRWTQFQ
jgi:hypothetical protein